MLSFRFCSDIEKKRNICSSLVGFHTFPTDIKKLKFFFLLQANGLVIMQDPNKVRSGHHAKWSCCFGPMDAFDNDRVFACSPFRCNLPSANAKRKIGVYTAGVLVSVRDTAICKVD